MKSLQQSSVLVCTVKTKEWPSSFPNSSSLQSWILSQIPRSNGWAICIFLYYMRFVEKLCKTSTLQFANDLENVWINSTTISHLEIVPGIETLYVQYNDLNNIEAKKFIDWVSFFPLKELFSSNLYISKYDISTTFFSVPCCDSYVSKLWYYRWRRHWPCEGSNCDCRRRNEQVKYLLSMEQSLQIGQSKYCFISTDLIVAFGAPHTSIRKRYLLRKLEGD